MCINEILFVVISLKQSEDFLVFTQSCSVTLMYIPETTNELSPKQ